jgi:Flp pilus assembly protein TadG
MRNILSRRSRDERGASLLEFALVIPVFALVLYALIFFGAALSTKHRVTSAAAEAARAAVGAPSPAQAETMAMDRVVQILGAPNGRYVRTAAASPCGTHQCVEVVVTWDYANHPVVPGEFGLENLIGGEGGTIVSKAMVQYA